VQNKNGEYEGILQWDGDADFQLIGSYQQGQGYYVTAVSLTNYPLVVFVTGDFTGINGLTMGNIAVWIGKNYTDAGGDWMSVGEWGSFPVNVNSLVISPTCSRKTNPPNLFLKIWLFVGSGLVLLLGSRIFYVWKRL